MIVLDEGSAPHPHKSANDDGLRLVVMSKRMESATVVSIELAAAGGSDLPKWDPGAHIDVIVGSGLIRQYSLCGDPRDRRRWRIAVLREQDGRGGSSFIHDVLRVGHELPVRGPRNNFELVEASRYLFIAGGIGITPFLPMIGELAACGKPWNLVYGGRARDSMAFLDELTPYGERVSVKPEVECGLLDVHGIVSRADEATAIYCCGPGPLIAAVERALPKTLAGQFHSERFAADVVSAPDDEKSFDLVLRRSGKILKVPPSCSVLDVLLDAGVDVETSCEEGICGSCETPVVSGRIDHRDHILTASGRARGDVMYVCVSRCLDDRLELDI
jgi:ferredoxin-NADP reductase